MEWTDDKYLFITVYNNNIIYGMYNISFYFLFYNRNVIIKAINENNEITKLSEIKIKEKRIILQCLNFDFIICLELMHPILQMILKVSKAL